MHRLLAVGGGKAQRRGRGTARGGGPLPGARLAVVEEARQRRWFLRRLRSNRLEGLATSATDVEHTITGPEISREYLSTCGLHPRLPGPSLSVVSARIPCMQ